jgi:hypothetical protein
MERPGITVAEMEVPADLSDREIHEVLQVLRVDVGSGRLVRR